MRDPIPPTVAFQGEPGAFSEEAIHRLFGPGVTTIPCPGFEQVGEVVLGGGAEYGVLPIENSIAGRVTPSLDVLRGGRLEVVEDVVVPIRLSLLGLTGATLPQLRRALSHPVALRQCTGFLGRWGIEAVEVRDTAGGAREVAGAGDPSLAAVASRRAGSMYGLHALALDVQDRPDNRTRFLLVRGHGTRSELPKGDAAVKSLLLLEIESRADRASALRHSLSSLGVGESAIEWIEWTGGARPGLVCAFVEVGAVLGTAGAPASREAADAGVVRLELLGCYGRAPAGGAGDWRVGEATAAFAPRRPGE